jgi:hypothetical protein
MKALPMSLHDKALLNARNMADNIKEFSSLNLSKHRSATNAFVHIIAAITAYQINPFKPKRILQTRYQLETTA